MHKMLKNILSSMVLLSIAINSHAMPPKPNKCPTAGAIKSAGLSYAEKEEGTYVVYQINNYGTKYTWGFGIGDIEATSSQQAMSKAFKALSTLSGTPTPMPIYEENVWACLYSTKAGYMSIAFTPLPMSAKMKSSMMIQRSLLPNL